MTIHERISELRRILGITQADFGEKINMARNTVTNLETGRRSVTDRTIADICRAFNVSEAWLRNGAGEMFVIDEDSHLLQLAATHGLTGLDRAIIEQYLLLNDAGREMLRTIVRNLANYIQAHPEETPARVADAVIFGKPHTLHAKQHDQETAAELDARAQAEEYYQQLLLENTTPKLPRLSAPASKAK